jgi:hypothetical protein
MGKFIFDNFNDVYEFRAAIQFRPDNGQAKQSSKTGKQDFAGMPYEQAEKALTDGLPEVADNLKRELKKFQAVASGQLTQRRPINYYNGHSPNVPAAIIGLPKSMRKVTKTPSKVKTVTIFYNSSANCDTDADILEKSGATVLQLLYWLELNGYRAKFVLTPYLATNSGEKVACNILLKDFRQPLDILKLSFSITSVSMFRRLGFRWLETVPGLETSWAWGYGSQVNNRAEALEMLKQTGHNTENAYFVMIKDCKKYILRK